MLKANDYIGIATLRYLTATTLRTLTGPKIIVSHSTPVAALVPYTLYLEWQEVLTAHPLLGRPVPPPPPEAEEHDEHDDDVLSRGRSADATRATGSPRSPHRGEP